MQQSVWYLGKAEPMWGDLLFVAYMDVGKGREQDAEALLGFDLVH
ncbi:hypothetical protein P3J6_110634 [Pseudoalteromonas sp. 3J6]|nr:hypothetical protein [Pseudoalteromonas sp. 3J6]CAD2224122.1 hypothetical protein P3J6_110634 [Pseudoalteromonas sp. 3J6]